METTPESQRISRETVPCALCGADDVKIKYRIRAESRQLHSLWLDGTPVVPDGPDQIVSCRRCGLVYVNPRIRQIPGLTAYNEAEELAYFESSYPARYTAYRTLLSKVGRWIDHPVESMVDIGCGDGAMLDAARSLAIPQIVGLEISPSLIARIKQRFQDGEVTVSNQPISELDPDSFDMVTLINVLEHLPHPKITLLEIQKCLKPGGLLLVHVPNLAGLPARIRGQAWNQLEPYSHFYYFTSKTLQAMLRSAGLTPAGRFHLRIDSGWRGELQDMLAGIGVYLDNGLGLVAIKGGKYG